MKTTVEQHEKMGSEIKEIEAMLRHFRDDNSDSLYAKQIDEILKIEDRIGRMKSALEDKMFADNPSLSNEKGFSIYY